MDYSEKNKGTLLKMQGINEALSALAIDGNELVFGDKRVPIDKFDIELLMGDSLPFESQLTTLTPEDVYKIISLHVVTLGDKAPTMAQSKNEQELEKIKEKNPKLANIVISTRKDAAGNVEEYINIVDSNGKDHLLHNYYKLDLAQMYLETLNRFGTVEITPEQLFESFKRRCVEVPLEDTYDMTHRSGTSEEFVAKMNDFEEKHLDDKHYALGNEANDILISNDHTVTSYTKDEDGNLIQNDFRDSTNNGEIQQNGNNEQANPSSLSTNEQNNELKINQEAKTAIKLISEEEFYNLINTLRDLTSEEYHQIELFNAYLEDLILYRDYLLPELKEILERYEKAMEGLALAESINYNQSTELDKYYEMQNNVENRLINDNNVSLENEVQKLKLTMPEQQGNVNPTAIILIMSGLVILMGVIAVIITR